MLEAAGVGRAAGGDAGHAVLFEGARLIVGDASSSIENSAFIVDNSRIGRVGRKGEVELPAGGVRVDLTGKTVMPALVSAHVHVGLLVGNDFGPQHYTRDTIVDHLQRGRVKKLTPDIYGPIIERRATRTRRWRAAWPG